MARVDEYLKNFLKKHAYHFYLICRHIPLGEVRKYGITTTKRKELIIVTLTSFPERIPYVCYTIRTLLQQVYKPDKVILWLAEEQFPQKEKDLPASLLDLKRYGLNISWCTDQKSFKKLVPAFQEYPEAILVTADDDVYYSRYWLKGLVNAYKKRPECIHAYIVRKLCLNKNRQLQLYPEKYSWEENGSYWNKVLGVGGVLYPPGILCGDGIREDLFMKLVPENDDLWFWAMGILKGHKIRQVKKKPQEILYVENSQITNCLWKYNTTVETPGGPTSFEVQLNNLEKKYNLIDTVLMCNEPYCAIQ